MSDIFISYAKGDRAKAELLADAISRQGWSAWWDRNIPPGKVFDDVIQEELDSARCVIVLWSNESIASDWVKAEADEGAKRGILVPVLIEDVRIPLAFRRLQAIAVSDLKGKPRQGGLAELLEHVDRILGNFRSTQNGAVCETSFSEWYDRNFGSIGLITQAILWIFWGFIWIPLWFFVKRARTKQRKN